MCILLRRQQLFQFHSVPVSSNDVPLFDLINTFATFMRPNHLTLALSRPLLNPSEPRGNYSATSNNMKLVHWLLMGGMLHLVQRGGDWAGLQPAQAPPRCTKCKQPTHQWPVCQSLYCCIMVRCSAVLMWVLKG